MSDRMMKTLIRDTHMLNEVGKRLALQLSARHHNGGAGGDNSMGQTPCVGMEHGHNGENNVALTNPDRVRRKAVEGMEELRPMGVDDALGVACRS